MCQKNIRLETNASTSTHTCTPRRTRSALSINTTDALDRAVNENVKVVGINDFYSMERLQRSGNDGCVFSAKAVPLFNVEFISLQKKTKPPAYG